MKISISDMKFVLWSRGRLLRVTLTLADGDEGLSLEGCLISGRLVDGKRRLIFSTPKSKFGPGKGGYHLARLSQGWTDAICQMVQKTKYFDLLCEDLVPESTAVPAEVVDSELPTVMTLEEAE